MQTELRGTTRIAGYDLARALAIWGMITVHFRVVMAFREKEPAWLHWCVDMLDGRAAALFVILAGVGISLRTAVVRSKAAPPGATTHVEQSVNLFAAERRTLIRRGLFLLVVGFVNLTIWR